MEDDILNTQLIPHVFLPLKLPGQASANLIAEENHLLSLFHKTIRDYRFIPQIIETCSAFETWFNVQVKNKSSCEDVKDAIQSLKPGQLFALYVRAQNSGLLISIPKDSPLDIIWSTFPASHKNNEITGKSKKIQFIFVYIVLNPF